MLRVMLIDDEESAMELLEILLKEIGGAEVAGRFLNPRKALEALEALQPDAVFLDIHMPGLLGMEAARQIKAKAPRSQIVFTTAYSDYALEAFEIHSADYLLKPVSKERLRKTVSFLADLAANDRTEDGRGEAAARVQCFGGFQIRTGRGMLPWKTNKVRELCAFLFHHGGRGVEASAIVEALWPEADFRRARTYLYTCISFLRKSFQEHGICPGIDKLGKGYAMEMKEFNSDVAEFSAIAENAIAGSSLDERCYDRMNTLYRGDYLEGIDFDWAYWRREELKSKYIRVLRMMHAHFQKNGRLALASDSLQRILALSPDSEQTGRELIRLYLSMDKRNEALKVFRQLDHHVRLNLGVELEEATVRLYNSMR